MAEAFSAIADAAAPDDQAARKIYLSRSRWPKVRQLQDELEVERLFSARGFEVIHPQLLPLSKQVALARSAKSLCGPVGSGMYLSAFQRAGSENFLIAPNDFALPDDRMLAHLTGTNLGYYFAPGRREGSKRGADWQLDLPRLAKAIDRWLEDRL